MTEALTSRRERDPYEHFPSREDWEAIQGGQPRVFRNPKRPESRWIVLHVYDEHGSAAKRFRNGRILDTPVPPPNIPKLNLLFKRLDDEGIEVARDVVIPSMMFYERHGSPCESLSVSVGGRPYDVISDQATYVALIRQYIEQGMEELVYGVQNRVEPTLIVQPRIRAPRPLE